MVIQQAPEPQPRKQAVLFQLSGEAARAVGDALKGQKMAVGEETHLADVRRVLKTDRPDFLIIGSSYLIKRGEALLASIKKDRPDISIIIAVADDDRQRISHLLGQRVSGFLCEPYYPRETLFVLTSAARAAETEAKDRIAEGLLANLGNPHKVFIGRSHNAQQIRRETSAARRGGGNVLFVGEGGTGKTQLSFCVHLMPGHFLTPLSLFDPLADVGKKKRAVSLFDNPYPSGTLIVKNSQHLSAREAALIESMLKKGAGSTHQGLRIIVQHDPAFGSAERFDRSFFAHRITIDPLRERPEDIGAIFDYYVNGFSKVLGIPRVSVTPSARKMLVRYRWPSNVRDLIGVVIFTMVTEAGGSIDPLSLPDFITRGEPDPLGRISLENLVSTKLKPIVSHMDLNTVEGLYNIILTRVEAPLIKIVLERTGRNQSKAAKILGINRNTLKKKIDEYRIGK
jgi:two-component system nitrogen regulation response regulator GlnG